MAAINEVIMSITVVIIFIVILITILHIPINVKACAMSIDEAMHPNAPSCGKLSVPSPVGIALNCSGGACDIPIGTCTDGGQCYQYRTSMRKMFFATGGRTIMFYGVLMICIIFVSYYIYNQYGRTWYQRHTYETHAPCDPRDLDNGDTFVYAPIDDNQTCDNSMKSTPDGVACMCSDAPNLKNGTSCKTNKDCSDGVKCMLQRQPCANIASIHSEQQDIARSL